MFTGKAFLVKTWNKYLHTNENTQHLLKQGESIH